MGITSEMTHGVKLPRPAFRCTPIAVRAIHRGPAPEGGTLAASVRLGGNASGGRLRGKSRVRAVLLCVDPGVFGAKQEDLR